MCERKSIECVNFEAIGKTDDLLTVSCLATKSCKVKYSCEEINFDDQKEKLKCHVHKGHEEEVNLPKFKRTEDQNKQRKREYFSQSHKETHEGKKRFWPTDLVQDETGETLRRLRSYVETHKINTYIKHDLANMECEKEGNSKSINNCPIELDESRKKIKDNTNGEFDMKRNFSESHRNKSKVLRIDYEVITILKGCNGKRDQSYTKTTGKSSSKKFATEKGNSSKKNHKGSDIKVSPSLSKLNENSPRSLSRVKFYQSPINSKLNSKQELEENFLQCKALDVHERQYLTPNTSTYFQSLNNSIEIESESECPQRVKSKNHKSHINIHNEEEFEDKTRSFHQRYPNTVQKHINETSISHVLTSGSQNKKRMLENENFFDNYAKYKNIINLSKNV